MGQEAAEIWTEQTALQAGLFLPPTLLSPMRVLRTPVATHLLGRRGVPHAPGNTVWLFDLDNTLHDSSRAIFKAIDQAMTAAVAASLELDLESASQLRTTYWKRYGATVIGMVRHHGIDAKTFLTRSHGFDIAPLVHAESGLRAKLLGLKGRKILLTNAPREYALTVLRTLGIVHQFESVWTIDHMRLQGRIKPKPSLALMQQVLARLGVPARNVVLVEDTLKNLKSARQAGMKTVHVFHPGTPFSTPYSGRNSYVGLRVNSVGKLLTSRYPPRG